MTGRFNVNWTPKLDFTDQTLVYVPILEDTRGAAQIHPY